MNKVILIEPILPHYRSDVFNLLDESEEFAVKRDISIGRQNPRYYEVLGGLEPGEKVIVSSYQNYADHDKLMLKHNR